MNSARIPHIDVRPLSNFELDMFYAEQPANIKAVLGYGGTYSRDELTKLPELPNSMHKLCYWIFNLDDVDGRGTHWVMLMRIPRGAKVAWEYFDSYGAPPPEEIIGLLKKAGAKDFDYSTYQLQPLGSAYCGYYCLYIVEHLLASMRHPPQYGGSGDTEFVPAPTMLYVLYDFGKNKRANDMVIYRWLMYSGMPKRYTRL